MKTTLNIRGDLLEKARQLTGIKKKTALVHLFNNFIIGFQYVKYILQIV